MPIKVAVCSSFRDSMVWHGRKINQVGRYFRQTEANAAAAGVTPSYYLVEGNSADRTSGWLKRHQRRLFPREIRLFHHHVTGSGVASVVSDTRFRNLSAVGNTVLRPARDSGADFVLWIESDFIISDDLLKTLLEATERPDWKDTLGVCPVPLAGDQFYDTWAFQGLDGRWWSGGEAEFFKTYPDRYLPLATAGSCILFNGSALRAHDLDFGEAGCLPGLCGGGQAAGLKLLCDTSIVIQHPNTENVGGRLI
jgi:GT2 family glycosyltransferase